MNQSSQTTSDSGSIKKSKGSTPRKRTVADFKFGLLIGEGSYSSVVDAVELSTNNRFAAKVVSKQLILKENKVKYVTIEREALTKLHGCPFILRLHYTFQDPSRLFYILDLAPKGELLYYLRRKFTFDEELTRFYVAELVSAIGYMHSKGVAHRDLKPENILIDNDWHIKICDFGSAKMVSTTENSSPQSNTPKEKASSFVGTADYASPELLEDREASHPSDLWALGCIIYQMLVGKPPFRAANDYMTFQKIIALEYLIPKSIPESASNIIQALLVKNPKERLGVANFQDLKSHKFFEGIDFDTLHLQKPPSFDVAPPLYGVDEEDPFYLDGGNLPIV